MRASPSALKAFEQCPRKWAFRRFAGLPKIDYPWFKFGRDLDGYAERYLTTGERPLGDDKPGELFLRGIKHLPAPGVATCQVPLTYTVDGHEIAGFADFVYVQGVGVVLGDHKSFGNATYNLTAQTLREDSQAVGYSGGLFDALDVDRVTVRWIYYDKRNVDAYPLPIQIEREANHAVARRKFLPMLDVMSALCEMNMTTVAEINTIPNDPSACDGCGRMCDYATHCKIY